MSIPPIDAELRARIYLVVAQVPRGMATSYGDVATIVGGGCDGRMVGRALSELPAERSAVVPWQRVINREGSISTHGLEQRRMLEAEGIAFGADGRLSWARCRWPGPEAAWAAAHGCHVLPPRDDAEQLSLF